MWARLETIKGKLELVVGLIGTLASVFTAVFTGLWFYVFHPWIVGWQNEFKSQIMSEVALKYDNQVKVLNKQLEDLKDNDIQDIKHKLLDEIDSTYYFTKTFNLTSTPTAAPTAAPQPTAQSSARLQTVKIADARQNEQEPMQQFFYAAPHDKVILFVWATETHFDIEVKVNDGPSKKLAQVGDKSTSGLDITDFVRNSPTLDSMQYAGIGDNVYLISLTPLYKEPKIKHSSQVDLEVDALLVIRRSPFQ